MRKLEKMIIPLVAVLFLGACSSGIRIHLEKKEYETDTLKVVAYTPQFSGMTHTEFQDDLNNQYKTDIDGWISETQQQADAGNSEYPYQLYVQQNIKTNRDYFVSMVTEIYQYTGGAHGLTTWIAKNIDDKAGKVITLADLFAENEDYKTVLNRTMQQMVENNKEEYQDLWEQPMITDNQGFYIQDGNLVIYYPPYELSYYARGFVEFSIPLKDIESYLSPNYKFLI